MLKSKSLEFEKPEVSTNLQSEVNKKRSKSFMKNYLSVSSWSINKPKSGGKDFNSTLTNSSFGQTHTSFGTYDSEATTRASVEWQSNIPRDSTYLTFKTVSEPQDLSSPAEMQQEIIENLHEQKKRFNGLYNAFMSTKKHIKENKSLFVLFTILTFS